MCALTGEQLWPVLELPEKLTPLELPGKRILDQAGQLRLCQARSHRADNGTELADWIALRGAVAADGFAVLVPGGDLPSAAASAAGLARAAAPVVTGAADAYVTVALGEGFGLMT